MLQPNTPHDLLGSDSTDGDDLSSVMRSTLPRGADGYAQQSRKLERTLGWVLWLGFAAVLVLSSL